MLVPRTQLLFWFAMLIVPFSLLGAIVPAVGLPAVIVMVAFLLLILADAVFAYGMLDDIKVQLPEIARFSKDRPGTLDVTLLYTGTTSKRVHLGIPFPSAIETPHETFVALLSGDVATSQVTWPCTPHTRGRYSLNRCYLESRSTLGFWAIRGHQPVNCEIRVYPNLAGDRHTLAALFLNRGTFGIHAQQQVGKGRDFEKLREYIPGDSFEDIHWKATAKRRHPITKVFQIERTQEVYVIVDTSRLSARPTQSQQNGPPTAILERFIIAALVMGLAAQKQGDLFGLVTFSDQIQSFVRARSGKAQYSACRDILYTLDTQPVNPDFNEVCTFLRLRLRRRALLIFLTNLDDVVLAEHFVKNMELIQRQHLVLVNMLRPPFVHPVFSHREVSTVEDVYRELGGHLLWHDLQELERTLHHRGIYFSLLAHEKLCIELVSQYVNIKRRQLL